MSNPINDAKPSRFSITEYNNTNDELVTEQDKETVSKPNTEKKHSSNQDPNRSNYIKRPLPQSFIQINGVYKRFRRMRHYFSVLNGLNVRKCYENQM